MRAEPVLYTPRAREMQLVLCAVVLSHPPSPSIVLGCCRIATGLVLREVPQRGPFEKETEDESQPNLFRIERGNAGDGLRSLSTAVPPAGRTICACRSQHQLAVLAGSRGGDDGYWKKCRGEGGDGGTDDFCSSRGARSVSKSFVTASLGNHGFRD